MLAQQLLHQAQVLIRERRPSVGVSEAHLGFDSEAVDVFAVESGAVEQPDGVALDSRPTCTRCSSGTWVRSASTRRSPPHASWGDTMKEEATDW